MSEDDKTREALKTMREQARTYGIRVDPKWTPEEFAQAIIDAQMALEAKEDEEFAKAKKIKVKMLRDGWPTANMRVPAGKTADIPIDMAKRWIEAGVCDRADPLPEGN